jgi:hypothetical protein
MDINAKILAEVKEIRDKAYYDGLALLSFHRWDQRIDIRITSITKLSRLLTGLHVAMHSLLQFEERSEDYWEENKFPQPDPEPIERFLNVASLFLRNGFISSLFSVIESSLRIYLAELNPEKHSKLIRAPEIAKQVLMKELREKRQHGYRAFKLLGHIRNSLHNNGVFNPPNGRPTSVEYRGEVYGFVPGEWVNHASWEKLLVMARDQAEMLFQVSRDARLLAVSTSIRDTSRGQIK